MTDFVFRVSPNVVIASYSASRLGQFVSEYGKRFMLVLDPVLRSVGLADKITQSLTDRQIDFFIFDEITEVADSKTAENALELARSSHIHGVIAAGGGKTVEIARAVAAYFYENGNVNSFLDGANVGKKTLPLIALSTTCRNPYVFTDRIALTDSRTNSLKLVKVQNALCKSAVFDPSLAVTLTDKQSAAMAIESVCFAAEAYFSQKASFFSDMIAEKAASLLLLALDGSQTLSVTTPKEELLFQGGCMASLAVSASSFGPAGLLALAINARFKLNRSLAALILFPYVIEFCAKFKSDRVAKFAKLFGVTLSSGNEDNDALSQAFADNIRNRIAKAGLPVRLKELSVSIEQLALAAEDASKTDYINSLPKAMTSDDLFELLKLAY